jgi:hypothetical protein
MICAYNSEKGKHAWSVFITKLALDRLLAGNAFLPGDKEIVLRSCLSRNALLWYLYKSGQLDDDDDLDLFRNKLENEHSYKLKMAWQGRDTILIANNWETLNCSKMSTLTNSRWPGRGTN